jgi:uncharacterized protein
MWIERDFKQNWSRTGLSIRLLTGPRQSGKSSFLRRRCNEARTWISLDDLHQRELAQRDPNLLLSSAVQEFVIDEVQLAPELLPQLKLRVDQWKMSDRSDPEPSFWLTGSNNILLDRALKESLAGRASYFKLLPLSVRELCRAELDPSPESLFSRGGWPELWTESKISPVQFLNDYITTVIEKDVVLAAGIQKVREFLRTVRLLAGRTGQMLVVSNLAQDSGVKQPTLHEWISVLESMQVLSLVEPYSSSLSKRLVRTPKLYFNDVGLATRLQGWSEMQPLLYSPQVGPLFETLVFTELLKASANDGRDWQFFYLRNKEHDEVDFLIEGSNQKRLLLEVKWSSDEAANWQVPKRLLPVAADIPQAVVSFVGGRSFHPGVTHLSIRELSNFLLETLG